MKTILIKKSVPFTDATDVGVTTVNSSFFCFLTSNRIDPLPILTLLVIALLSTFPLMYNSEFLWTLINVPSSKYKNEKKMPRPKYWSGWCLKPFSIEFPNWCVAAINVNLWNKVIIPTTEFQFHLWLPDIAMQFNYNNIPCVTIPALYCLNNQELKTLLYFFE